MIGAGDVPSKFFLNHSGLFSLFFGVLCFHMKVKIILSNSVNNCVEILIVVALNL